MLSKRIGIILTAFFALAWGFWPITSSALHGDDIPNSMRSAVLAYSSQSPWGAISGAIAQWIRNEGRFFPVSAIENVYLFSIIHSVALYKLLQWAVLLLLVGLVAWYVRILTRVKGAELLVAICALASLQTRNWYDPTFGFGLLLQSVAAKVFLSGIFLHYAIVGKRRIVWLAVSVLIWTLALLQYEVVITLLPILVVTSLLSEQRTSRRTAFSVLPHCVVAIAFFVFSQSLRSGKVASPAYTTNIDLQAVVPTYLRQLSASVPFSAHLWHITPRSLISAIAGWGIVPFVVVATFASISLRLGGQQKALQLRNLFGLLIVGLNLMLGPGLPTSLSVRWQAELAWGLGYLPVFLQYIGLVFILVAFVLGVNRFISRAVLRRLILAAVFVLLVFSATANRQLLLDNVAAQQPERNARLMYENAVRNGLFNHVPAGSIVRTPMADPNFWVNNYFTAWLGGPRDIAFVRSEAERESLCASVDCSKARIFQLQSFEVSNGVKGLALFRFDERLDGDSAHLGSVRIALPAHADPPCATPGQSFSRKSVVVYDCLNGQIKTSTFVKKLIAD